MASFVTGSATDKYIDPARYQQAVELFRKMDSCDRREFFKEKTSLGRLLALAFWTEHNGETRFSAVLDEQSTRVFHNNVFVIEKDAVKAIEDKLKINPDNILPNIGFTTDSLAAGLVNLAQNVFDYKKERGLQKQ